MLAPCATEPSSGWPKPIRKDGRPFRTTYRPPHFSRREKGKGARHRRPCPLCQPILAAQFTAQDLANSRVRQRIAELDMAGR